MPKKHLCLALAGLLSLGCSAGQAQGEGPIIQVFLGSLSLDDQPLV